MIRIEDEYSESQAADANYTEGSFKNVSSPGGTDGTPFEKAWANDIQGFLQSLTGAAGITPSGVPDTVLASDIFNALKFVAGKNIYSADIDYEVNSTCQGLDGGIYRAKIANGPTSSVVDPVGDSTGTWILENMVFNSAYNMITQVSSPYENQNVKTLGFYDGNLDGGAEFIWMPSINKNTANGGTIIDPDNIGGWDGTFGTIVATYYGGSGQGTGVGSGCWVAIDQLSITPEQFGITQADADQSALIAKMFDAVVATGITKINGNKNGTYRCDTTVTKSPSNLDMFDFILNCTNNTTTGVLFTGSKGSDIALTANAVRGDTSVQIASGQSIVPGDIVFLNSGTVYWNVGNTLPLTEFKVVKTYSGTTLTFHDHLEYAYTTAGGSSLFVTDFISNIHLTNCGGIGAIGNTSEAYEFLYTKDCTIDISKFENFDSRGIQVSYSINLIITKPVFLLPAGTATGTRYGVSFGSGAESCKCLDAYCSGLRHPVAQGGGSALTRRCEERGTISLQALSGLDQHSACDECVTEGYVEFSSEVLASEDGASIQGNRPIVDVRVKGSTRHGIILQYQVDYTGGAPAWIKAKGISEDSIEMGVVLSIIAGGQVDWVDMDFNTIRCGTRGGFINVDNSSTLDRVKVRGRYENLSTVVNVFQMTVPNASGAYVGYIDIDGEFINDPSSTTQVVSLDWDSGIPHADGGRISGKFKNGTTGLRTLDSSGNISAGPIVTQNVTTPINLSGANNSIFGNVDF